MKVTREIELIFRVEVEVEENASDEEVAAAAVQTWKNDLFGDTHQRWHDHIAVIRERL